MKELKTLERLYLDEIQKINDNGGLTSADSEAAIKALEAIEMIEKLCDKDDGYSEGMNRRYYNPYYNNYQHMPEMYSRGDATEHMIHELEKMLQIAPTERHKETINDCIMKLRNY